MHISNPENLHDLLERLEADGAPDRELDQDIFCELGLAPAAADGTLMAYLAPQFTGDANSLADHVQQLCPGAHMVLWPSEAGASVEMTFPHNPGETFWGSAPTPPRAFLACLMVALISMHQADGKDGAASLGNR